MYVHVVDVDISSTIIMVHTIALLLSATTAWRIRRQWLVVQLKSLLQWMLTINNIGFGRYIFLFFPVLTMNYCMAESYFTALKHSGVVLRQRTLSFALCYIPLLTSLIMC